MPALIQSFCFFPVQILYMVIGHPGRPGVNVKEEKTALNALMKGAEHVRIQLLNTMALVKVNQKKGNMDVI